MKKAISVVLLFTAVFFGLASCEGDYIDPGALAMGGEGIGGGGHGGGGSGGSGGTFTLTGIPSQHNGRYAVFFSDNVEVVGCQNVDSNWTTTLVQIANGSISLPMWNMTSGQAVGYSGSHTDGGVVLIYSSATQIQYNWPDYIAGRYFSSITFSNGSATKDWSQGTNY